MPAYTYDQFCADLDAAFADPQPNEAAALPQPSNDNLINDNLDDLIVDEPRVIYVAPDPCDPATYLPTHRPATWLDHHKAELRARKIREQLAASNSSQTHASSGVGADRDQATSLRPSLPLSSTSTRTFSNPSTTPRLQAPANQNRKPWRDLDEEKDGQTLDAMEAAGAFSWRVTFSPVEEARYRSLVGVKDMRVVMGKALNDHCRRRLGYVPALSLVVEEAPGTRKLHAHGIQLGVDRDQFIKILKAFGGNVDGQGSGNWWWHAPCAIRDHETWTARRYIGYGHKTNKAARATKRRLGLDGLTWFNRPAMQLGRDTYENARKAPQAAVVPPESVLAPMSDDERLASLDDELAALNPLPAQEDDLVLDADDLAAIDAWLGHAPGAAATPIDEIMALLDDFNVDGEDQAILDHIPAVATAVLTQEHPANARKVFLMPVTPGMDALLYTDHPVHFDPRGTSPPFSRAVVDRFVGPLP